MSYERKRLSDLIDRPIRLLNAGDLANVEIRDDNDVLLATVSIDDLFDENGNRFENDLD
jgi:hypothetical protein